MWRLFYPLRYFRLENAEKSRIDWLAAATLAVLIAAPFVFLPGTSFFKNGGFLDKLLVLTSALTGFYVAALVAAATFSHPDLDKVITVGPIALVTRDEDGTKIREALSRREFVCTIFGYLAFLAFVLSALSSFAIAISGSNLFGAINSEWFIYVRAAVILVFCAMTSHLAVVTSLGIYYLMDRLYRKDRQIISKKSDSRAA